MCGYHGLTFDRSGRCVRIPGQDRIPERARVRAFPLVEQDAFLWIWMGDPAKADRPQIVSYPWHNDTANWPHKHTMYPIKSAAMLMVDNLMDLTHLGLCPCRRTHRRQPNDPCRGEDGHRAHAAGAEVHPVDADEAQQTRLSELGEAALVDITTDAARLHMRRTVDRLLAEEAQGLAAQ